MFLGGRLARRGRYLRYRYRCRLALIALLRFLPSTSTRYIWNARLPIWNPCLSDFCSHTYTSHKLHSRCLGHLRTLSSELISDKLFYAAICSETFWKMKRRQGSNPCRPPGPCFEECVHSRSAGSGILSGTIDSCIRLVGLRRSDRAGCLFHWMISGAPGLVYLSERILGRVGQIGREHS